MAATKTKKKAKAKTGATTHIAFLLDESGSMGGVRDDVIEGFNEFTGKLRSETEGNKVLVNLTTFDAHGREPVCRTPLESIPLEGVREISTEDYRPRGGTPLHDAVGETITNLAARVKSGEKAMLVIYTDGHENSSKEWRADTISTLIREKEAEGWTFIYMGANHDAWGAASAMGMSAKGQSFSTSSTRGGTRSMLSTASSIGAAYVNEDGAYPQGLYRSNAAAIGDTVGETIDATTDEKLAEALKTASEKVGE